MALTARASAGGNFKPVPVGQHLARCYRIIDLGTQYSEKFGNFQRKAMFQFEVHAEQDDGTPLLTEKGEPYSISKNYTVSLNEKSNLYKDLIAWRGRAFTQAELAGLELKNILGAWAMITVIETSKTDGQGSPRTFHNIGSISQVPKQMKASLPEGHNPLVFFDAEDPDMAVFEVLGEKIKAQIQQSPEFKSSSAAKNVAQAAPKPAPKPSSGFDDMDDDIPF